jgi:hypothetical protein
VIEAFVLTVVVSEFTVVSSVLTEAASALVANWASETPTDPLVDFGLLRIERPIKTQKIFFWVYSMTIVICSLGMDWRHKLHCDLSMRLW